MPEAVPSGDMLYPVVVHGKWGFIDRQGNVVVRPQHDAVEQFSEQRAWFRAGGKCGYIDPSGKVVVAPRFDRLGTYREGLARAAVDFGIRPLPPERLESSRYQMVIPSGPGAAALLGVGQVARMNPALEASVRAHMDRLSGHLDRVEGLVRKWGFVDRNGEWKIAPDFCVAQGFSEGLAAVIRCTEADWQRMAVLVLCASSVDPFRQRLVLDHEWPDIVRHLFARGPAWSYVDSAGTQVISGHLNRPDNGQRSGIRYAESFHAGTATVAEDLTIENSPLDGYGGCNHRSIWHRIDKQGRIVSTSNTEGGPLRVGPLDDEERDVSSDSRESTNGCPAPVRHVRRRLFGKRLVRYGYVDDTGKKVVPARFDHAGCFRGALAQVRIGNRVGYIDRAGKYVWAPTE